jgi:hypothetical protein
MIRHVLDHHISKGLRAAIGAKDSRGCKESCRSTLFRVEGPWRDMLEVKMKIGVPTFIYLVINEVYVWLKRRNLGLQ